jgi:hypothetical protein
MKPADGHTAPQRQQQQHHLPHQQQHNSDAGAEQHSNVSVQHLHASDVGNHGDLPADSSAEQSMIVAGSSATHDPGSNAAGGSSKPNSSMGPDTTAASVLPGRHVHPKYMVPSFVAVAFVTWLVRRVRRGSNSSTASSRTGPKRRRQQQGQKQAVTQPPLPLEPEFSRSLYASAFSLIGQEAPVVSGPAALQGVSCVVAEHIPIQVGAVCICV